MKNRVQIIRKKEGVQSTISHLYIDGVFACYLLEDKIRAVKIPHETAIPSGNYKLVVNKDGGKNIDYTKKFGSWHKGMIEISGIPNFKNVYIHIGNFIRDTYGCPLTGASFSKKNGDYIMENSTTAYLKVYPVLLQIATSADNSIIVRNDLLIS